MYVIYYGLSHNPYNHPVGRTTITMMERKLKLRVTTVTREQASPLNKSPVTGNLSQEHVCNYIEPGVGGRSRASKEEA